jgi:hypothetical protein
MREERDPKAPFVNNVSDEDWQKYEDWDESLDEDVERDWMLAQQELEDFEQSDEYFGYYGEDHDYF